MAISCNTPKQSVSRLHSNRNNCTPNQLKHCWIIDGTHWIVDKTFVFTINFVFDWLHFSVSKPAPLFEGTAVVNGEFTQLSLTDYIGKYVVFFFYPLDFTFVCPTEILAFSDRIKEFQKINTEVIACSVDSHFTHLAWINTPRKEVSERIDWEEKDTNSCSFYLQGGLGKINIPLLSDISHKIAKDYGVYLDDLGHSLRGLFIIDHRGILRQITMNVSAHFFS